MEAIVVQKRDIKKKELQRLRAKGFIPAVLYGPKLESVALTVDQKQFDRLYKEAGESSLVNIEMDGATFPSLIHEVQRNPISGELVHVDFYQPDLTKEVEVMVPIVFEGEAPAVRELGGTLLRNIQEIEVSALPQDLPHNIVVSIAGLKTFEEKILVKDLQLASGVSIARDAEDMVAQVVPVEDVDAELEVPIEEDVTAVEGGEKVKEPEEGAEVKTEESGEAAENKEKREE